MTPIANQTRAHRPNQTLPALLALLLPATALLATRAEASPPPLRFVVIAKVGHPWFEAVRGGAVAAAAMIQRQSGSAATIDYRAPASAEVTAQAEILAAAIRSRPTGITIDLLDAARLRPLLEQARQQGPLQRGQGEQIGPGRRFGHQSSRSWGGVPGWGRPCWWW